MCDIRQGRTRASVRRSVREQIKGGQISSSPEPLHIIFLCQDPFAVLHNIGRTSTAALLSTIGPFKVARQALGQVVPDIELLKDEELEREHIWTYWMNRIPGKI